MAHHVFFVSARAHKWTYDDSLPGKFEKALAKIRLSSYYDKDEWVAVKTHFGSQGAHRIIRPIFLRKVSDALHSVGAKPVITDSVRIQGLEYLEIANQNGINHLSCGAPVVLADGLYGKDNLMVKAGDILKEIAVPTLIHDVTAMVVCSHFKGHINAGFGGAIKNMAMGCVSSEHRHCGWQKGRGAMHTFGDGMITWEGEKCILCRQCEEVCPLDAIEFKNETIHWNESMCWRCGRCERVCQSDALHLPADDNRFMRSLSEATQAVLSTFKEKKVLYINFLTEIQPECDCMPIADVPIVQDKGILISDDIVAVEQASIDMLKSAPVLPDSALSGKELTDKDDIFMSLHHKPYMLQIEEAERLGLGSRDYQLIEITA
jgi:uncharacterized Fe-S center protein